MGQSERVASHSYTYFTSVKYTAQWEAAIYPRELSLVLCDDQEGRDGRGRGRLKREGIYVCL